MGRNVARIVRSDHLKMIRLSERLRDHPRNRAQLLGDLTAMFAEHTMAARDVLVPEATRRVPEISNDSASQLTDSEQLLRRVRDLTDVDPASSSFTSQATDLVAEVRRHDRDETVQVLDPMQRRLAPQKLREIGELYIRVDGAADGPRSQPIPRRWDLPRTQLYEKARRAGIEGRSAMTRSELIGALRAREQSPR